MEEESSILIPLNLVVSLPGIRHVLPAYFFSFI